MTSVVATEHASGLHADYQVRTCPECNPNGAAAAIAQEPMTAPTATRPRPRWQVAPHTFRGSSLHDTEGERLCECGAPRMAEIHVAANAGNLTEGLRKVVAHATHRDPREVPLDVQWSDPYAEIEPLDGGPACGACRGFRRTRADVAPGHPLFGKLVECPAPECAAFLAQQRLSKLLGELPLHFRDWTLERVAAEYPKSAIGARLGELARHWLEESDNPWMLLYGKSGRGKTVFAVSILKAALAMAGRSGSFQEAGQVLRLVRSTYRNKDAYHADETDILAALHGADLLVLDDLGKENDTDWASELLDTTATLEQQPPPTPSSASKSYPRSRICPSRARPLLQRPRRPRDALNATVTPTRTAFGRASNAAWSRATDRIRGAAARTPSTR
jgi:hypothetical protein